MFITFPQKAKQNFVNIYSVVLFANKPFISCHLLYLQRFARFRTFSKEKASQNKTQKSRWEQKSRQLSSFPIQNLKRRPPTSRSHCTEWHDCCGSDTACAAFMVDDTGLEPVTSRTSSGFSAVGYAGVALFSGIAFYLALRYAVVNREQLSYFCRTACMGNNKIAPLRKHILRFEKFFWKVAHERATLHRFLP